MAVNEPAATFGDLLRDHRRAAGLTQEELAERAGVSPRSISEMERGGQHVPRRDTVALLVRALGLSGTERELFEALIERGRRPRLRPAPEGPRLHTVPTEHRFERPKHNLPRALTSLIGREQELVELARVLPTTPLLTLVGAGGVGKTRLAQELVREHCENYADGAWLVELAGLCDGSLILSAVIEAVGLRETHARNLLNALTEYLRPKQVLLVLDNCEHLVADCAVLVAQLLRSCPKLQVLATSREPLAIAGEMTWRVPPLELPDLQRPLSLEEITRAPAVRLFIERARAVNNNLLLTEANLPAIARICVGVDGIPLALELAAARARVLTLEQLAERLEYDSGILGAVDRSGLPQHQTIRATIDWSYDLLGEPERALLRRLSVFAGGWTLRLAEQVCADGGIEPGEVLNLLTQLVDKSIALVDATHAEARYRLLEPIRQYAQERLQTSDEATRYRGRHAAAFLELAQTSSVNPGGPDEIAVLDRIEVEHDNMRTALRWALNNQQGAAALRASAALFYFWERRGHFQEGCAWLEQALAAAGDDATEDRGRALNALATLYWRGADAERAEAIAEQALVANRAVHGTRDIAWALINLGMIAYFRGQSALAIDRLQESVRVSRVGGPVPLLSLGLTFLARARVWQNGVNDPDAAAELAESLSLAEAAQSRTATAHALMTLGDLAWWQGDVQRAVPLWLRGLDVRSRQADRRGIADALERLAWGFAATQQFESAAWFFGAAEAQHTALGVELRHDELTDHQRLVAATREQLGDGFEGAWQAGQAATTDEAITFGLATTI